jgi:hypothetical protein
MSLDKVTIEAVAYPEGAFNINPIPYPPKAKVGFSERFGNGSHLITITIYFCYSETYPIMSDALVYF